jgi:hypothetical protein
MRACSLLLLLAGCSGLPPEALPTPTLPEVGAGNTLAQAPETDQWAILGPEALVLSLPGLTDAEPEPGAAWAPLQRGDLVWIPLVDQALDDESSAALMSLLGGQQPQDPQLRLQVHAALPASTLMTLKDLLHWAQLTQPWLEVRTPRGQEWLAVDLVGGANRALYLTADGLTPVAHRAGVPAYTPPAAEDVQGRAQALLSHYPTLGNHTVLLLAEPERHDIQRALEALAAIDGPRMLMVPEAKPHTRRLEAVMDPRRPRVSLERIEITSMDAADARAHDRLLWTQVKLTSPGLVGVMDCYSAALETNPGLAGELSVRLRLDREGTHAEASGLGDEALGGCVEAAVSDAIKPYGEARLELVAVLRMETQPKPPSGG